MNFCSKVGTFLGTHRAWNVKSFTRIKSFAKNVNWGNKQFTIRMLWKDQRNVNVSVRSFREDFPEKKTPFYWELTKLGGPSCLNWCWHFLKTKKLPKFLWEVAVVMLSKTLRLPQVFYNQGLSSLRRSVSYVRAEHWPRLIPVGKYTSAPRAGGPTPYKGWAHLQGGQRSVSLEYQTCTSAYLFDTLVTGKNQVTSVIGFITS